MDAVRPLQTRCKPVANGPQMALASQLELVAPICRRVGAAVCTGPGGLVGKLVNVATGERRDHSVRRCSARSR
jgi:hypothetical protein